MLMNRKQLSHSLFTYQDYHATYFTMRLQNGWRSLDVAVIGGGIGGLAAAISLRRAGHHVTVYERADYAGEVGASISCAANGTRWLHEWEVDVATGDPVVLRKLINRDWKTGEPVSEYDLSDYEEKWGYVSLSIHTGSTAVAKTGLAGVLYVPSPVYAQDVDGHGGGSREGHSCQDCREPQGTQRLSGARPIDLTQSTV